MPTENSATEDYHARHAQSGHRDASELTAFACRSSRQMCSQRIRTSGRSASQFKPLGDDYRMVARPEIGRLLQTGPLLAQLPQLSALKSPTLRLLLTFDTKRA